MEMKSSTIVPKPHILLVDDVPENLEILKVILERNKYQVDFAYSGAQALDKLNGTKPDLILLDILMPGMSGYEVCRIIKNQKDTQNIPVVFLTAKGASDDVLKGFELGAVDYILKPFDVNEVLVRVRTHIELKKALDERGKIAEELHKLNEKLVEVEEEIIALKTAKERFISLMEHDLKEPADSLLGLTELLVGDLESLSKPELINITSAINNSSKQMSNLLGKVLEWAYFFFEKPTNKYEKIELSTFIDSLLTTFSYLIEKNNITIINNIPKDSFISSDKNILNAAIGNLFYNLMKLAKISSTITYSFFSSDEKISMIIDCVGLMFTTDQKNNLLRAADAALDEERKDVIISTASLAFSSEIAKKIGVQIKYEATKKDTTVFIIDFPKSNDF
jgi:DNA-binding response OmpR family regulator/uncharacterized membrane protein